MGDQDTQEKILDAAHAVFVRNGSAGARMQEVADEAGVNKALLHYYFRSKERLAQAVFARAARTLIPGIVGALLSDLPLEAKVRAVVSLEIDVLSKNPFLPNYILGELTHHPERIRQMFEDAFGSRIEAAGGELLSKLRRQLEEGARSGELRPMAPEQFVLNLFSLVIFPFAARPLVRLVLGLGDEDFEEVIERRRELLPEFIMNAMRP